ncbi:hypothetical protein ACFVYT_01350 [Streptomyces sp. NPDC058290]|uniref:hypothetical protein n=1 Tax=Streptomyces sp. NPDC058290 TaxID=3346426 RepID=UPI0036E10DA0
MRATFRTAAVTAGAVTALALPVAQAFAADTPSTEAQPIEREALRTVNLGFVLNPDGSLKGRTGGAAKPEPEKATPKGGVRAGAEKAGASGDGAALIAGGAGLASAGAAGLGFTVLRRRRSKR